MRTIRTAAAFSSGLYLRVVGFPGDCSFGIAPSSFPRSGASRISRAIHVLLEFYRYPAEHWIHLRTTNPIESTFATVRLRTKVTKGPGSRAAGIAMAYKLIDAAQARWRAVNAPHLVALVRAGAVFHKGKLLERPVDITPPEPAESAETEVA
ncbi:ISAfe2, transposase [Mycobacterium avium 104]|uniref:Mutator family transposase n=1 Tax=Mycobacterium avium (strain 104) TaxID=243243 RepID=A0A0H2ZVY0_MYCA1|nr:ISAfe2, transposase [Mycobacterium avium 104]